MREITLGAFEDSVAIVDDTVVTPIPNATGHAKANVGEVFHSATAVDEGTQDRS